MSISVPNLTKLSSFTSEIYPNIEISKVGYLATVTHGSGEAERQTQQTHILIIIIARLLFAVSVALMTLLLLTITAHFTVWFIVFPVITGRTVTAGHPVWRWFAAWSTGRTVFGGHILTQQAVNNLLSELCRIKTPVAFVKLVENIPICESYFSNAVEHCMVPLH